MSRPTHPRRAPRRRARRLAALSGAGVLAFSWLGGCGPDEHWEDEIAGAAVPREVVLGKRLAQSVGRAGLDEVIAPRQILFGDLHVHTSHSWDGFLFTLPLVGGEGAHPPADACDFARYCANLDFYALTDHAETLLPTAWADVKQSVRQCNAVAGDEEAPDLVAFTGFEWSQAGLTPETHYGHRNVVFRDTAEDALPARPIGAGAKRDIHASLRGIVQAVRWIQPWGWGAYTSYADYLGALGERERCDPDAPVRSLPLDCEEVAATPAELHRKLDDWGFESLEIPHGTTWGTYTPAGADMAKQLVPGDFDPDRQRLIEIMSGHGNAEVYRDWAPFELDENGERQCPAPADDYLPCCWQAGEIMRGRCGDLPADECERRVALARRYAASVPVRPHQVFPDAAPEEWLDCGQCRDCAKPSFAYRPRESVQYTMALSRPAGSDDEDPLRFRYGFVASSDGHTSRPGTGYKQVERSMMTDAVGTPSPVFDRFAAWAQAMDDPDMPLEPEPGPIGVMGSDMRVQSFLYPGGLAAVHADGRSRDAIWDALRRREVYGTSGPRILLWFDLMNGGPDPLPMGSAARLAETPRFRVRALGSFEPLPGCSEWNRRGLPAERLERLCRGECWNPSDTRRGIRAIEVIRIRPQLHTDEDPALLIEDPWRRFDCGDDPAGCAVEFDDPDFAGSGRDALYYVRALEVPSLALNGRPLETRFDDQGNAVSVRVCRGEGSEDGCPAEHQERAWSSPIFLDQPR